jgi:hypothetical protein
MRAAPSGSPAEEGPRARNRRRAYAGVVVLEGLLGAAILTFYLPFADARPTGNVEGSDSPIWFWLVQGSPRRAIAAGTVSLVLLVLVDLLRRWLRRRWHEDIEWW